MGSRAYAQTGALTVHNGSICTAYFRMSGVAPAELDLSCDIYTGNIAVAPGATVSWSSVSSFASSLGFAYIHHAVTWSNVNDFQWTDVVFQFTCPHPTCSSDMGGVMTQPLPPASIPYYQCFGAGTTWTGTGCTSGSWSEAFSAGSAMNNVTINF